jgi:phage shock protein E
MSVYDLRHRKLGLAAGLFVLFAFAIGCGEPAAPGSSIGPEDALARLRGEDPPLFLDVRTPSEYERAHIPGALNIPHTQVAERIEEIRAEGADEIIVFCERGGRAREASAALDAAGIGGHTHMAGHMRTWRTRRLPTVTGSERGELTN